jgi:ferric-dicitrate binding protein FerR (iron transport regulator)
LPDKSVVWLNSVSAIRFPIKFSGTERRIELTGEAEFKITKDAGKPFIVQMITEKGEPKGTAIRVLGTHFNVTAYDNEPAITTTLIEGSVEVLHNKRADTLRPGQQAVMCNNVRAEIKKVDVQTYIAHKKGIYDFKNAPVKTIMNQVERMYNVKVIYKNENYLDLGNYTITLEQDENLKDLIASFDQSGDFECKLSDDQTTVTVSGKAKQSQ